MDSNSNTCPKYKHLNQEERVIIKMYKNDGLSLSAIARKLNRHKSTISRELRRNPVMLKNSDLTERVEYHADTAQILYKNRRKNTGAKIKLFQCDKQIHYVENKIINDKWSPDAAVGRYKLDHPFDTCVTAKTIYNYIDLGLIDIKPIDLLLKVKLRTKKKRIRVNKKKLGDSIEKT